MFGKCIANYTFNDLGIQMRKGICVSRLGTHADQLIPHNTLESFNRPSRKTSSVQAPNAQLHATRDNPVN